jgi:putative aldouronate transport system substrate-binding protein
MKVCIKQLSNGLVALMLSMMFLSGCAKVQSDPTTSSKASTSTSIDSTNDSNEVITNNLDEVTLTMYLIGDQAKDYDEMLTEFNAHAQKDLNAKLEVVWVGWGDYETVFPLVLSSGEAIDLIYAATWVDFYNLAQKGAYLPIEDLVSSYAPQSIAKQTASAINQARVNGHLYALAATYADYEQFGYIVRGDLMDKFGIEKIVSIDDYGKYLKAVAQNEPELDPSGLYGSTNVLLTVYLYNLGYYPANGSFTTNSPFGIKVDTGKVVNIAELPEILDYYKTMKSLSDEGCWSKSVLSNNDSDMFIKGRSASAIHNLDTWTNVYMAHNDQDIRYYPAWPYSYIPNFMSNGMAIPASSKNPERALMLLEKMRNDPLYYNLLTYGREGVDYR